MVDAICASGIMVGVDAPVAARERELPDLMIRYQHGDREGVEELIRRLSPLLLRFFLASSALRQEAEDLLQECWIRIHRARHTYHPPQPVLPWIFAIARHTKVDGYRKIHRRRVREVLTADPPETISTAANAAECQSPDLTALLQALPDSQREVLFMLKVAGMTLEETARASSSTVGAIKQKAHRAYTTLRGLIEKGRAK